MFLVVAHVYCAGIAIVLLRLARDAITFPAFLPLLVMITDINL